VAKDNRTDLKVRISNPKNPYFGKLGVITKLDRGNVYVRLDEGTRKTNPPIPSWKDAKGSGICTRWSSLEPVDDIDAFIVGREIKTPGFSSLVTEARKKSK